MSHPFTQKVISSGEFLQHHLEEVCKEVVGLDTHTANGYLCKGRVYNGDIQILDDLDQVPVNPHIVVLGEILEHLVNPGMALRNISIRYPNAEIIATVPNAFGHFATHWAEKGVERVHDDHVAWYSPCTIKTLFERSGYLVKSMYGYSKDGFSGLRSNGLIVRAVR